MKAQGTECPRAGSTHDPKYGFPRTLLLETVWKVKIVPIVESDERADRNQQALFGHLTLPETTINESFSYFPDSLSRDCLESPDGYQTGAAQANIEGLG